MISYMLKRILWIFIFLALLVGGLSLLPGRQNLLQDSDTQLQLVYLGILITYLMLSPKLMESLPAHTMARYAVVWVGIFAVGLVGYSFKDRLKMVLMPDLAQERQNNNHENILSVRAAPDGHFYVTADVEGAPIRFMIDTGATNVALTLRDAKRIGHEPSSSDYNQMTMTANGRALSAPITLGSIAIRNLRMDNVRASIMNTSEGVSLLGLSFLSRLKSWSVKGDTLEMIAEQ